MEAVPISKEVRRRTDGRLSLAGRATGDWIDTAVAFAILSLVCAIAAQQGVRGKGVGCMTLQSIFPLLYWV